MSVRRGTSTQKVVGRLFIIIIISLKQLRTDKAKPVSMKSGTTLAVPAAPLCSYRKYLDYTEQDSALQAGMPIQSNRQDSRFLIAIFSIDWIVDWIVLYFVDWIADWIVIYFVDWIGLDWIGNPDCG